MCANQLSLPPPPFQKVIIRLKKNSRESKAIGKDFSFVPNHPAPP